MKRRKKRIARKKGLSSGAPVRRKRKGLSSGVISGANLKNSAINTALGALGGAGATVITKLTTKLTKGNIFLDILAGSVVGFVASALGAPKIGIGYTGGTTALALAGGLKDEDTEFADEDSLEEGEIYETENGEFVKMLNDGSLEYLNDDEVQALNDGGVYPEYSTMEAFQNY